MVLFPNLADLKLAGRIIEEIKKNKSSVRLDESSELYVSKKHILNSDPRSFLLIRRWMLTESCSGFGSVLDFKAKDF